MSRANLVRAVLAFGVLAVSLMFTLTESPRLGLDLRGGSQIVLETRAAPGAPANAENTDRARDVLERRVNALGVAESSITRSGENRIIVELPDVQDPSEAAEVIGRTAQLTAHPVLTQDGKPPAQGQQVLRDESGQELKIGPAALTGEGIGSASAGIDPQSGGGWFVTIDFRGNGGQAWQKVTADAACQMDDRRRVAIVLDKEIISSPQVNQDVRCGVGIAGGSTQITGNFSAEEAKDLAALIQGGSLPVPVEIIEQRVVGPTLGAEAIDASARAAIVGIAVTGLFIIFVYRIAGLLATLALACYALISYAALVAIGATLTLPGLAGFVLAIGMAIDANVLAFERAREEYAENPKKGLGRSLSTGFSKAWSAIADSNITTLLAAGLLFFLASGPVRGFGVTLVIGVLASMVSAMLISRVLTEAVLSRRYFEKRPRLSGLDGIGRIRTWLERRKPDLMGRRRFWLGLSALLVVVSALGIGVRGLNYGVEFTGGRLMEYSTTRTVDVDRARAAVADAGFPRAVVQRSGDNDVSVRTEDISNADQQRIEKALGELGGGVTKERDELIGPSLGDELRRNALIALGIALLAQLAYLAVRFRWTFGAGAVIGLFHDAMIVVGVFAWLGKPIDGVFLAAMLTVIGYSVNDSVVMFDRVRELWGAKPKERFDRIVNLGALQTIPRTVYTGMGATIILAALAFFGGDSLRDFAIALLIGINVGMYSTVFIAGPASIELERFAKSPPPRQKTLKRPQRDTRDSGAVV
ncbi:protein translocase subunit SecD [Actinomadura flavalba]|uniref:protein translocase subunit SecD n=1 Tax=Actinomadura flavalba TaxID=1120938 RepID=UPI00035FB25E|nr:protein translocase subunit SecD [Actinomadura flavalba]